jgi:glutamine amidotransferase
MIPGEVVSLGVLGPRIGWCGIHVANTEDVVAHSSWFSTPSNFFYFNHNFASKPTDPADVRLVTADGDSIPAMIERDNVTGVQFHPERSQRAGRHFLQQWLLTKVRDVHP